MYPLVELYFHLPAFAFRNTASAYNYFAGVYHMSDPSVFGMIASNNVGDIPVLHLINFHDFQSYFKSLSCLYQNGFLQ